MSASRMSRSAAAVTSSELALPSLESGIRRAADHLLSLQHDDGHWCGELEGDTILESEYILLMAFLEREADEKCRKAANYLLRQQNAEGGWSNYPGGPTCLSTTVKAYFALKLTGHSPAATYMRRARELILGKGGASGCNSFTRFYLALLGQIPYDLCPAVPPELVLLPKWFYVNLYAMSSWTRTIVVPLSIFYARKPVRRLPPERGIAELFQRSPWQAQPPEIRSRRLLTWRNFFIQVNRWLQWLDKGIRNRANPFFAPLRRLRAHAVDEAARWMFTRLADSDGLGAIFPPMIYTVISLRCLGYQLDSKPVRDALQQIENLMIEEGDSIRLQPCLSPVWDTALTLNALAMTEHADRSPLQKGVEWLLQREVRIKGDWSEIVEGVDPSGWAFEYRNPFYPDIDDTSMVLLALARIGDHLRVRTELADTAQRAIRWMLAFQNRDGGWAAFDRDIDREVLTEIPFADHNAMLDPSCPDITARVLEALAAWGYTRDHPQIAKAIRYLERTQDSRGCWYGRWGVNYIYGTWQVLQGLKAIGYDMASPSVRKAVRWLQGVQQAGGGWGESCYSYEDPTTAGQGEPTASQTAWAILGLIAAGEARSAAVAAGVKYLLATQQGNGSWREEPFTGTGFPKVFYLRYHYYPLYFPLMALARYHQELAAGSRQRRTQTEFRNDHTTLSGPHRRAISAESMTCDSR